MNSTTERNIEIVSTGGLKLSGKLTERESPKGMLVIVHGLGEHGACYEEMLAYLAGRTEFDFLWLDQRGHGISPGKRGYVATYDELAEDLEAALAWLAQERPGLPVYLHGHSNGGTVTLLEVMERKRFPIAGVILSNPTLHLGEPVPKHVRNLAKFLFRFAPRVTLDAKLDPAKMCSDEAKQRERLADTLRHRRISAPLFFGMESTGARCFDRAETFDLPLLMILGGADPIVNSASSRSFFDRVGSLEKQLAFYPEMRHEPYNEVGRERVYEAIATWLNARPF